MTPLKKISNKLSSSFGAKNPLIPFTATIGNSPTQLAGATTLRGTVISPPLYVGILTSLLTTPRPLTPQERIP